MNVLDSGNHNNRVALVVGAGSKGGIGFACANTLAASGARVALADLRSSGVTDVLTLLPKGSSATAHHVDVTDPVSVEQLVKEVVDQHGRLDSVVNAAGVLLMERFMDVTLEAWETSFAVNARGMLLVGQSVARQMIRQKSGGRIVAISSNAGRVPRLSTVSYGASKCAIIQLVRCMALELAPYNITVNALCPGSTATSMMVDVQAKGDPERLEGVIRGNIEQWRTGIPLGRLAEPEDQAAVAAFLLSEGGRHITGQAICVDGGQTFF